MHPRNGWNQPAGWGQPPLPGWAPLIDDRPLPLHTARSVGRWLWPTLATTGFLTLAGFALRHDDPAPGLSIRGLVTITLAGLVVTLLTIRRGAGPGPLARALFEYGVVFLLAVLVATTGVPVNQPAATGNKTAAAADQRPALVKSIDGFRDWLSEWRQWAHTQTNRRAQSAATLDPSRHPDPSPTLLSPSTRSPL